MKLVRNKFLNFFFYKKIKIKLFELVVKLVSIVKKHLNLLINIFNRFHFETRYMNKIFM